MPLPDRAAWDALDQTVRGWWDGDQKNALNASPEGTLLYLPYPYLTPGGSEAAFNEMYGWDTYFINLGLLAHGRLDFLQNHILNHAHMVETYGRVLNGNRTYYLGRSQPPLLADSVRLFMRAGGDAAVIRQVYPLLQQEYRGYWEAEHHNTPVGLATNRDLTTSPLRPALAAEAETGLDAGFSVVGNLRMAQTEARMDEYRLYSTTTETAGVYHEFLSPREVADRWPLLRSEDLRGALFHPQDGYINPADVTMAMAKGARQRITAMAMSQRHHAM